MPAAAAPIYRTLVSTALTYSGYQSDDRGIGRWPLPGIRERRLTDNHHWPIGRDRAV